MKYFISFILLLSIPATLVARYWVYLQYNPTSKDNAAIQESLYSVSVYSPSEQDIVKAPDLPDISHFKTTETNKKIPKINGGSSRVTPLSQSYEYKKINLQRLIPMYQAMQIQTGANERLEDVFPGITEIGDNIPDISPGETRVTELDKSYEYRKIKIQKLIPMYEDMQNRLGALSIELIDGTFNLDTIVEEINDPALIEKTDTAFLLKVPLLVAPEATLVITGKDKPLKMSVNSGAFLSNFGKLYIHNADVRGWNLEDNKPAKFAGDKSFRPHIVTWCGSEMYITGSDLSHLGYFASKAYGITYTSCHDLVYEAQPFLDRPKGWVIDNKFVDIYYGFYSYEADNIAIIGNIYENNVIYGIDPHDRSTHLIIAHNIVYGTKKKHGIIVSREVDHSFIFNNTSYNNAGSGFMIDRDSKHNVIAYNISRDNQGDGLTFYESPDNLSWKNILSGNKNSGLRVRNSQNIVSRHDVINNNGKVGVQGYTSDLTANGGTRDLEMDPYKQEMSIDIGDTEMVGNGEADFKFLTPDTVRLSRIKQFRSPNRVFGGDLKNNGIEKISEISETGKGILIEKKKAATPLTQ